MSLSLEKNVIVDGDENRPPMLDKTNYSSWASQPGNETTQAMIRARTYTDLTNEEKIRELVDIKAKNTVFQGLPQDNYNLVNHNKDAKQIWDRVKLLIQGSELSLPERESKLYHDFDTFTSLHGEIIHSYYMRQHEAHANEVHLSRQRYLDQIALVANSPTCLNPTQYYPQLSSSTQQYYSPPAPQCSYDAPIVQQSHKGLERSCTSSKSVAPMRNRIFVYPNSDEEDEDEVNIERMTLEEYARYELAMLTMKNEIQVPTQGFTSQFFNQLQYTPKLPLGEEECDDINDYEDYDQENGELLDLPTFSSTNEIASDSEQVEENIDMAEEKEEVPMKDVEMDKNQDIDHSGTEEALQ
ncbi:hypothetical protein Tco_0477200 [Tanacetum coccineum]